jgi:replicative DNA helicase
MRAYDTELEMQVIKSAVASPQRMAELRKLGGSNLFHYTAAKELFERTNKIIRKTGDAPSWKELMHDPLVSESIREIMPETGRLIKPENRFIRRSKQLETYARIRYGLDAAVEISELMKEESVDPDQLTEILAKAANQSRKVVEEDVFRHFGKASTRTGKDALRDLMEAGTNNFIPTRFKSYDDRSRGFARPSLILIASESGGGKTKLAGQLRYNMSLQGYRVGMWSLEMDHNELEMRHISQITQIPMEKFLFPERLSKKEKRKIVECYDKYQERLKEVGGSASFAVPDGDVDMDSILAQSEPLGFDCSIIDYVSLLEDASEAEQWRALSEAARKGKRWSKTNNCTLILLAQLKEDETLKMAKYMKDHANIMWTWKFGELEQLTRVLHIRQQKSRNQPMYDFYLKDDTDTMTIRDPTEEELREYQKVAGGGKRSSLNDYEKFKKRR